MDVERIADKIIQRTGLAFFVVLKNKRSTSKQKNVCTAHIAWYICIFQQFNNNSIQMAYRIFCLMYSLKDCLVIYIIRFLE